MPKEIERKFLVTSNAYKAGITPVLIQQGFISTEKDRVVRVRVKGDKAFLTIKNAGIGISRNEYEYPIPQEDAKELLEGFCLQPLLEKYRYIVEYEGHTWEVDEFLGENEGLVVAEIELRSEDDPFRKPDWLGNEVTRDERYYNANLVDHPYNIW